MSAPTLINSIAVLLAAAALAASAVLLAVGFGVGQ